MFFYYYRRSLHLKLLLWFFLSVGIILNNSCSGDSEIIDYLLIDNTKLPEEIRLGLFYQVTIPNGDELWKIGEDYYITWNSFNANDSIIYTGNVIIEIYADGILYEIIIGPTENTGSYSWTIPSDYMENTIYKIRVSDPSQPLYYDESDGYFTLTTEDVPTITITKPNGGESWAIGGTHTITWEIGGMVRMKELVLGIDTYNIASNQTPFNIKDPRLDLINDSHDQVSELKNLTARKKKSSKGFSHHKSTSELSEIQAGGKYKKMPMKTYSDLENSQEQFLLSDSSSTVKIELYSVGDLYETITESTENSGSYSWTISPYDVGESYTIKIADVAFPGVYDFSDDVFTLKDSTYYQLSSPNGGEMWNEEDTVSITWSSGGDVYGNVILYYSMDPDTNWINCGSYTANDGEYTWVIPNLTSSSDSSLLKVQDYSNSSLYDISDAYFTMTADSTYYSVTSPNGGETWEELSTQTITWESSGDVESSNEYVSLYYSLDGGAGWTEIDNSEYNDGSYSWTLPEIYITNATCRIKVKQKYSPYIEDISDADFTISAGGGQSDIINVISANGGEVWHEQTTEEISWSTTGDIGGNEVYVGYSTDGGNYWSDAVAPYSSNEETTDPPYTNTWEQMSNNGSYSWSLPNFSDTLETCIIGVWSAANTALYDMSDNHFTITCDSNYYRILHPNGGEAFQMGTERYVLWESGGDVGSVKLYYSEYGGDSWYSIDANETNDGAYVWSVPTLQSDNPNCLIKIEDRSNSGWLDVSDATFTIAETVTETYDMDFEDGEDISDWTFGGNWTINSDDAYSGTGSAYCTGSDVYTMSTIATVNSGVVRFFYKADFYNSNNSYNSLKFKVDDVEFLFTYQDQSSWTLVEVFLESGTHTFEWILDGYSSSSSYYARIDAISFP
jgi:hypothetical protein